MSALKQYKPTTPGQRQLINIDRSDLWKGKPVKSLTKGLTSSGGRNNHGRVTVWNRGGGHKRTYRMVDFKRRLQDVVGTVERLEYDPNRTAFLALVSYEDGTQAYIIAPQKLSVGDNVVSAVKADIKPGNCMELRNIPVGTIIHNVELKCGKGAQIARSAGSYAQIIGRDGAFVSLRLMSGEVRLVRSECHAVIGAVSNADHKNRSHGKAGRRRWMGRRPVVRGVAMNPVDHPHGGGEGKTSGGRHPVTPWGVKTRGVKTRKNKRTDKLILKRRKK